MASPVQTEAQAVDQSQLGTSQQLTRHWPKASPMATSNSRGHLLPTGPSWGEPESFSVRIGLWSINWLHVFDHVAFDRTLVVTRSSTA